MTEYKMRATQGGRGGGGGQGNIQVNQTEGGYYGRIIVDQTNDQVILCGDTNTTISRDGGKTFQATGWDSPGTTPMPIHVDHRSSVDGSCQSESHPQRQ